MEEKTLIIVNLEDEGKRIDKFIAENLPTFSRSYIQTLINNNFVKVNNKTIKSSYKVLENDKVEVFIKKEENKLIPKDIKLDVVYEDKNLIIINKPQGMVVHPGSGNNTNTLVNALLFHYKDLSSVNGENRPGIVHRLDKDTSGLLMVAKNDKTHKNLAKQLKDKSVVRVYLALVNGVIKEERGLINAPIGRDPKKRTRMTVIKDGKEAITHFKVLERFKSFTLVECKLETGRTHQIRVHMAYINHPLVGDTTYGPKKSLYGNKQYLHAKELSFIHPTSKKEVTFKSELPNYFNKTLDSLRVKQ